MTDHLVGWVALCLLPRIGGRTLSALLDAFGSPRAVFDAPVEALLDVPRIGRGTAESIRALDLDHIAQQIAQWQAAGITLLTWQDAHYPAPLQGLSDRPPLLFARGQLEQTWERVVAIVGTREPHIESTFLAGDMARELTRRGWLVVSGLARGVDTAAHTGAVGVGATVAVLGSGVDNIHPGRNRDLAARILRQGAIYAEVPPDVAPTPAALMARNRLISGMARATIVIEAGLGSGSMEAARRARMQGRAVFTVNHPAYDGNQALIRMEAQHIPPAYQDWDAFDALLTNLPEPPRQLSFFDSLGEDESGQLPLF